MDEDIATAISAPVPERFVGRAQPASLGAGESGPDDPTAQRPRPWDRGVNHHGVDHHRAEGEARSTGTLTVLPRRHRWASVARRAAASVLLAIPVIVAAAVGMALVAR
jgi:hypothetical protein